MKTTTFAEYKVGRNKGRPRIWIDGKRLADAGFIGGATYLCTVSTGRIECARLTSPLNDDVVLSDGTRQRKVTGRADGKPIIDLLGRDVEAAFPGVERVSVTFEPGKLLILAVRKESL